MTTTIRRTWSAEVETKTESQTSSWSIGVSPLCEIVFKQQTQDGISQVISIGDVVGDDLFNLHKLFSSYDINSVDCAFGKLNLTYDGSILTIGFARQPIHGEINIVINSIHEKREIADMFLQAHEFYSTGKEQSEDRT